MTTTSDFDARSTYGGAAEEYEAAAGRFWGFLTSRTLELLDLIPGEQILDVACGTGLLLPGAADAVGPHGRVLGVDYAPEMLAIARRRVADLPNVELRHTDMTDLGLGSFDAVSCVLGLFFVEDMGAFLSALESHLADVGRLVVAVFGEEFYRPMVDVFVTAVRTEAPELDVVQPWSRTAALGDLLDVVAAARVDSFSVVSEHVQLGIDQTGWRQIAKGSGLRHTLDRLGPERAERVLQRCDRYLARNRLDRVTVSARYLVIDHSTAPRSSSVRVATRGYPNRAVSRARSTPSVSSR